MLGSNPTRMAVSLVTQVVIYSVNGGYSVKAYWMSDWKVPWQTLYLHLFFQMTPMVAGLQPHIFGDPPVWQDTGTQKVVQGRVFFYAKLGCCIKYKTQFWLHQNLWSKQIRILISHSRKPSMSVRKWALKVPRNNIGLNNGSFF